VERWFLILVAAFFVWTSSAHAETKVVVRSFSGPGAGPIRKAVAKQVGALKGVKVVDEAQVKRAAKRRGVNLSGAVGRKEVAADLGIAAWVDGRVKKKAGKLEATVTVIDASSGDSVDSASFKGKKPKQVEAQVKTTFKKKLGSAFNNVSAPEQQYEPPAEQEESVPEVQPEPEPESTPVAQARDEESATGFATNDREEWKMDGDPEEPEDEREWSAFEARVAMGVLNRGLEYNEPVTQNVGNYSLPAAPIADVGVRVYPGAFFSDSKGAQIVGLDIHGQFAFGVASESSDGTRYESSYAAYDASLMGRWPIKRHELHLAVGYGVQTFSMEDKGGVDAPVPDVDYRGIRAGGGGRYQIADGYNLGLDAAYLVLSSLGELKSKNWFPQASGAGLQAQLFADARVYKGLSARLFAAYQRNFFDFNSTTADLRVAGGAVDQYITAGLGVGYTY
jgi:hypothetical protein